MKAEVVQPKDEEKPPPPPPPDLAKPPPPFVPPPELNIATEAPATNAITAVQAVQPTPPAPSAASRRPRPVGRTHDCASYYPDLSRRLNESGDVLVHYDVGVDGAITNVGVSEVERFGSSRSGRGLVRVHALAQ